MATAAKKVPGRPFLPGQSGNPNGRPKGTSITSVLRSRLTDEDKIAIADALIRGAKAGEMDKIREVMDRHDGKVPNRNENGDPGDFDADLSDVDTRTLKAALKRVK
jgi:hypothetical protein